MSSQARAFAFTVVASVASSLITLLILGVMDRARSAAARAPLPGPIVPGHGTA